MKFSEIEIESINNVYKNAHIALQSISNVLEEVKRQEFRKELQDQYEGYEKFISKVTSFMREHNLEPKDVNVMKKAMLWTSIKMNTLTDDSTSHVADMMIKGTVMGITELIQLLNRGENQLSEPIKDLIRELKELEESYEERLKAFL